MAVENIAPVLESSVVEQETHEAHYHVDSSKPCPRDQRLLDVFIEIAP